MSRILISLATIVLMLVAAGAMFTTMVNNRPGVEERPVEEPSYNVDVFEVEQITFREMLSAFGTAAADREVVLAAQVTGEIVELGPQVRVGRAVSAGEIDSTAEGQSVRVSPDLLARIDARDYQARVEQAEATIASSNTEIQQLEQQKRNLERQARAWQAGSFQPGGRLQENQVAARSRSWFKKRSDSCTAGDAALRRHHYSAGESDLSDSSSDRPPPNREKRVPRQNASGPPMMLSERP